MTKLARVEASLVCLRTRDGVWLDGVVAGTDPLAQPREIPAPLSAVMSPEAAALEAEILDMPPKP